MIYDTSSEADISILMSSSVSFLELDRMLGSFSFLLRVVTSSVPFNIVFLFIDSLVDLRFRLTGEVGPNLCLYSIDHSLAVCFFI